MKEWISGKETDASSNYSSIITKEVPETPKVAEYVFSENLINVYRKEKKINKFLKGNGVFSINISALLHDCQ